MNFFSKKTGSLAALSIMALGPVKAFAAQGLTPQMQPNGFMQILNNLSGMFPGLYTFLMLVFLLLGVWVIGRACFFIYRNTTEQQRQPTPPSKILIMFISGALLTSVGTVAKMATSTIFSPGYESQSVQVNNTNPFN